MEALQFHHSLPIQPRFTDVDKYGHVNHTVSFSFYDLGKSEYLKTIRPELDEEQEGVVIVHIETDFLAQIKASEPIAVETATTAIGTKSFDLVQRAVNTATGEVKCICRSVLVAFDVKLGQSKPLDEAWIEAICRFEGRNLRKKRS